MNNIKRFLLAAILLMGLAPTQKASAQEISFQVFYDQLSPYGQWVSDPQYGNVWVPNAGPDFRPYGTGGHWVMTDYGNTWVSDYPWGWAPFHYGRWTFSPYYGWIWVPGYEWGPAWVSWRNGGGYYGWAPLSPGITFGVAVGGYSCPNDWWVFIQPQYMYRPDYYHYWGGPRGNVTIINRTTIINNTYINNSTHTTYVIGPRPTEVQRFTHQNVPVYHINSASRPGAPSMNGSSLNIYHPMVNRASMNTARPANVMRAPQAIGNASPAAASSNRTPAFHAVMQQRNPSLRPATSTTPAPQPQNRPQVAPTPSRQTPMPQQNRPQMQSQAQQQNRPQPQMSRPQVQPQPQNRPQPQRPQPQQQNWQQAPQQRPQQQRPQPQMSRPQPQAPQQRPQPQPQHMQAPPQQHVEEPHPQPREGGERR